MLNLKAKGIIVPMITPLKEDESVDYNKLEAVLSHITDGGADGLFQISTTGEYARLSHVDRFELARLTIQYARGRATTYLGVSDTSTKQVLQNMETLAKLQPDCFVCSPPYYYPMTGAGEAISFFSEVVKNSSLPIMLYNIPATCGAYISIDVLKELMQYDAVIGIKDSSGNLPYFKELMELKKIRPDFAVLSGSEALMMDAAKLGCDGYVPSLANVFPKLFSGFMESAGKADWNEAERLFDIIMRMNELNNYSDSWLSAVTWRKTALSRMGLCDPHMIRPYSPLSGKDIENVDAFINEYNALFYE